MTRGEIRTEVYRRLRESSSSPVFWVAADLNRAIDEGYAEISDATEWNEVSNAIRIPAKIPAFDVRQFLTGSEFLCLGPGYNNATSRWLTPTTPQSLDATDQSWETREAMPEYVMARNPWMIEYWPYGGTGTNTITQYYTALPTPFASDSDEPGFPLAYHYGIVEYALFDLWAQDAEVALASTAWKAYQEYEAGLSGCVNSRASVPMRHGWRGTVGA